MESALAEVTRTGHNGAMPRVRVTKLKAKLSHYLRLVRKGETVEVYDRDKPVAEIIPYRKNRLRVTPPEDPAGKWFETPLPPPLPPEVAKAAMDMYWEDRRKEADRFLEGVRPGEAP